LVNIKIGDKISSGIYGDVYVGKWQNKEVCVKKPKSERLLINFCAAHRNWSSLNHPNLITVFGLYDEYLVFEYFNDGTLFTELRKNQNYFTLKAFIKLASQIASGMQYLANQKVLHLNLSCSNILIERQNSYTIIAKLSEFGFNPLDIKESDFPFQWSSPEFLDRKLYSFPSDVWSYAVTIWEAFQFEKKPFDKLTLAQLKTELANGKKLEKPANCPEELYHLLDECWVKDPLQRITFEPIIFDLQDMFNRIDESGKLKPRVDNPDETQEIDESIKEEVFYEPEKKGKGTRKKNALKKSKIENSKTTKNG